MSLKSRRIPLIFHSYSIDIPLTEEITVAMEVVSEVTEDYMNIPLIFQ